MTFLQEKALEILKQHSKKYPITAKYLAGQLEMKQQLKGQEQANVRSIIHALRVKGFPICSSTRGYWYAENSFELSEYIVKLEGRISKIQQTVDGLNKSFDRVKDRMTEETLSEEEKIRKEYTKYLI